MWLSFCDSDRPEGEQFLGAAIVPGTNVLEGAMSATILHCNPGGEVVGIPIQAHMFDAIPPLYLHRLLSREQAKDLDAVLMRPRP